MNEVSVLRVRSYVLYISSLSVFTPCSLSLPISGVITLLEQTLAQNTDRCLYTRLMQTN